MCDERRIALAGTGTVSKELVVALEAAFDVTSIPRGHANDVIQDGIDGLVFDRCFEARSPSAVIPDTSPPVPVIVVADPRTVHPSEIFSAGADAFVDGIGPGVGERVRHRINDRLQAPQGATTAGLPDRRADLLALLENAPIPIGIVDTDGTIKFANQATADFVGAEDTAAVEGEAVLSFAASETVPATERRLGSVIENRIQTDFTLPTTAPRSHPMTATRTSNRGTPRRPTGPASDWRSSIRSSRPMTGR